ncbi:carbon-nitrogen hydrolase family protein [Nocardioides gilvus]|uniref:carbon-nitrogen hydrolase family protein n=1 Tax=Nocardioides gilvus TaxID=1735589 RepID=UPI000D740B82|nr:carbon-nitrogen hydrolase family protein [Nocardioides gilvus]
MATTTSTAAGPGQPGEPGEGKQTLRVRLVQVAASLDPSANRARLADVLGESERGELVVFPEVFARDFGKPGSDVSPFAEPLDGPFVTAVEEGARAAGVSVVAGMFRVGEDPQRPYNTLVVRGESSASYDKIHLYDSFGHKESDRLLAGGWEPVVVEIGGFRVGLMTCYDLRFPELGRALVDAGAEVIVLPAAWVAGERKVDHWLTLARARAIENTVYVVAVGQPAPRYTGHSTVISPWGDVVAQAGPDEEVLTAVLERETIGAARRANPSLDNRRR